MTNQLYPCLWFNSGAKAAADPEKAPKVIQAFMQMAKFDIQTLVDA